MSKPAVIQKYEKKQMKQDLPDFHVGDTVAVKTRITEGNKERIQTFTGTVIARKGTGLSETFSLHRVAYGEGMERVFLLHSPRIAGIEVVREGHVRRAKLYYLRGTSGKRSKVRGRVVARSKKAAANSALPKEETTQKKTAEPAVPVEEKLEMAPETEAKSTEKKETTEE